MQLTSVTKIQQVRYQPNRGLSVPRAKRRRLARTANRRVLRPALAGR